MRIKRDKLEELISAGDLREIFIEHLHWDKYRGQIRDVPVKFAEEEYKFSVAGIAQKQGFVVFHARCEEMPKRSVRQKLEADLLKVHYKHILVLEDDKGQQKWIYTADKPDKSAYFVEISARPVAFLIDKLLEFVFDINEEDELTITEVSERANAAFTQNTERVTSQFYDRFREELQKFSGFIKGIKELVDKEHYGSLMLNRLMFVYFIQKKGYLNGEKKYLQNRLATVRKKHGKDNFYGIFYRHFLKTLFHQGLGAPQEERKPEVNELIGKVPYLNGGLFDEHQIELGNKDINIPDKAFEGIFKFFDDFQWVLDDRANASGKDINPDVIGYIFEKYINDRGPKGAYYTKEDITGYIARNTILPALLQKARNKCKEAFDSQSGTIWELLRGNPDNYFYESARKGCDKPDADLPENIRRGLNSAAPNLSRRRADWNKKADEKFALSGETWRETIARRRRYFALKEKIKNSGITDIADLTTHNLNIQKLTEDTIAKHEGVDFLSAFYFAIAGRKKEEGEYVNERRRLTVLDPACGSGAFLFAALNVLQPLYKKCIARMHTFVDEDDILLKNIPRSQKKHKKYRRILEEIEQHPNENYWICRNIILHNLFGVDIMPDAVEVAKLRLFLKLAAESVGDDTKRNMGLEPLPDIDFNIRAGNSLVGFSDMAEFEKAAESAKGEKKSLDYGGLSKDIRKRAEVVGMTYKNFVDKQAVSDIGEESFREEKKNLEKRLKPLNEKLNEYLARNYGIIRDIKSKEMPKLKFSKWKKTHQPFHWFAEFYDTMENGGFDVVIGNPPYVGYTPKFREKEYTVMGYETENARDLYAFVIEKSLHLLGKKGLFGMITPLSITASDRCKTLRELFKNRKIWASSFADRPGSLFAEAHQMLTITIANNAINESAHSTGFNHWYQAERGHLFANLEYGSLCFVDGVWGKVVNGVESKIINKIINQKFSLQSYFIPSGEMVSVCSGTGGYYLRAFNFSQESREYRELYADRKKAVSITGIINSGVFYWFWRKFSNCRHLRRADMQRFKIDLTNTLIENLNTPARNAIDALERTKEFREGDLSYFQYRPAKAKVAFDEIDKILAKHYGFTEEELDYIINYDYKYRMSSAKTAMSVEE